MLNLLRYLFLSSVLLLVYNSHSQRTSAITERDTLRLSYRSGGAIDSVDLYLFPNLSTLPGGFSESAFLMPTSLFVTCPNGRTSQEVQFSRMKFSALPHIGFGYSFGSKGTQAVKARYEQFFGKHTLLNLSFDQLRSNSFLRNGQYAFNEFGGQLNHARKQFVFHLMANYKSATKNQNDGLLNDSLVNQFDLEFLAVRKNSAESKSKKASVIANFIADFNKDTTVTSGVFTEHGVIVQNWRYTEVDGLSSNYSVIVYDSLQTADHYQHSTLSNGSGYYYARQSNQLKIGLFADYWRVFNLSRLFDTTEVRVAGEWNSKFKKLQTHLFYENRLTGADYSQTAKLRLYKTFNRLEVAFFANYSDQLPDQFLRYHLSNTYTPIVHWKKEKRLNGSLKSVFNLNKSATIHFNYSLQLLRDNYFFVAGQWNNTLINDLTVHQARVGAEYNLGKANVKAFYSFTYSGHSLHPFPAHRFDTRILMKGFLFKAKKLLAYGGLDVQLQSSSGSFSYVSMIDAFTFNDLDRINPSFLNTHAFAGFQIDQFRFFLRIENLGYLWSNKQIQFVEGYTISPLQFRVGITWDFFN